jgi:hypothetical protein
MQIVDIAIPLPSVVIPWKKDELGRNSAEVPGLGTIVELPPDDAAAARELAKENTNPQTLGFDLKFSDGKQGLFVRALDLDDSQEKSISA